MCVEICSQCLSSAERSLFFLKNGDEYRVYCVLLITRVLALLAFVIIWTDQKKS